MTKVSCLKRELYYLKNVSLKIHKISIIFNKISQFGVDFIADPDCLIVSCDFLDFKRTLRKPFEFIIEQQDRIESLKRVRLFQNLTPSKLSTLINLFIIEKFEDSQNIFTQGDGGNSLYIIKSGLVDIFINDNYIRTLNENEYFGERTLFYSENRSATAKTKGKVELYKISREDFQKILDDSMRKHLTNRLQLQDNNIELQDLDFVSELGEGQYGKVCLVYCRKQYCYFAIKIMSRELIDSEETHECVEFEKKILLQLDHPFIIKLVKTLSDKSHIYFLMEVVNGKELYGVIRDIGLLDDFTSQFYFISILETLNYLHKRRFIYRDIKPENVMVNEDGFIKLIDFGASKLISDRTSTIIGTPHYMAPEVLLGQGYSFSADIWSLGICLYEFICGKVPFGNELESPLDVYKSILEDQLNFPKFVLNKKFLDLSARMLKKDLLNRLFKYEDLISHQYFENFEFENLNSLSLIPPHRPSVKSFNKITISSSTKEFKQYMKSVKFPKIAQVNQISEKKKKNFEEFHQKF